ECTCFLSHQSLRPGLGTALRFHQQHGTAIVRFGGNRCDRIATLRKHLHGRHAWVIPLGGSSWLGAVGFVNAGLELAAQIQAGDLPTPTRIYVALGTMGTAVGLALGLALARLDIEVQAIRVTERQYANEAAAAHLVDKTAKLMRHYDSSIPADLSDRARLVCRNEFFGDGYGRSNEATEAAITIADKQLGLTLDSTYSGKAMAAVLHDLRAGYSAPVLFWNTYNSQPLDVDTNVAPDFDVMPREFARYFA
ncbi:MAG: pyridoxal-phosphate dependent enzyme, partial [Gammaproteobacteria bacterium]|nr:pyridoxal-phosphate dependent enzyme [Gammaproteobacteria bacterium]